MVLGVEKKATAKLQDERTVQKICVLDDHVMMAFAGLTADARIIMKKARYYNRPFCRPLHKTIVKRKLCIRLLCLLASLAPAGGLKPFGLGVGPSGASGETEESLDPVAFSSC